MQWEIVLYTETRTNRRTPAQQPVRVALCLRKMLQAGTGCGQAATAWPSAMAWLVFHSDTTAGSTRLLDSQGDQNIEYGTAAASLAPSTAERLALPAPLLLASRKEGKRRKNKTLLDNGIPAVQCPLIHLGEWTLAPLSAVLELIPKLPSVHGSLVNMHASAMAVSPRSDCHDGTAAGTLRASSARHYAKRIPGRSNKSPSSCQGTAHGLELLPGSAPGVGPSLVLLTPHTLKPSAQLRRWEPHWLTDSLMSHLKHRPTPSWYQQKPTETEF